MTSSPTDERLRHYWDSHAASYDREMAFMERILFEDGRQWACSQATGEVLEVAIGTGRNLPFYPQNIRLTGIEFSPAMLDIARERAAYLARQVDLRPGDAQALDLPDASFDTVGCTLSRCGIPDERRAVREMKRVLRPGGYLILLDHIVASPGWARAIQWLLERITIPLGGEHFRRRPRLTAEAEGVWSSRQPSAGSWALWNACCCVNPSSTATPSPDYSRSVHGAFMDSRRGLK